VEIDPDLTEEESKAMQRSRSAPSALIALLAIAAIFVSACGGATTSPSAAASAAAPSAAVSAAPSVVAVTPEPLAAGPGPNGGQVVRWFIGIGSGGKPEQIAAEQKFAADFNAAQKDVYLSVEIYDNSVAASTLQLQIASGNPPDIIGPVGVEGLNIFIDNLLDLAPLIASQNFDMTKFNPALVDFFKMGAAGETIGVPFATYPSFVYYNKKLFDEAKLPYPPTKVDELYEGKPWDMEAVRQLGMKLTVDKNGNDATSAEFDANNVVQWGYDMQWADDRADSEATPFGASSVVGADGKTAQITEQFKAGLHWFNDGVWKDHFIPTYPQIQSDLLAKGNPFQSGNLAMAETHSWYMCCINPAAPAKAGFTWGVAVAPAYNGVTTAKLHADTFSILDTSKNPELAFTALAAMVQSNELLVNYGAFPADPALQQSFFDTTQKNYPDSKIDWTVPQAMLGYVDKPNHQAWMPDYQKSRTALKALWNKYRTTEGLDIDAELATLQTTLQGIFDEYYAAN
jgi:multiple sugar transport system substrate-binding protein